MSESMSVQDVSYTRSGTPAMSEQKRAHSTSRRMRLRAPARLPMLDWPADLFSDNATAVELINEDFPMHGDCANMPLAA